MSKNKVLSGSPLPAALGASFPAFECFETREAALAFIPKPEAKGFQTSTDGEGFDAVEHGFGIVGALQFIVGNAGAQMMDVMKTDVA